MYNTKLSHSFSQRKFQQSFLSRIEIDSLFDRLLPFTVYIDKPFVTFVNRGSNLALNESLRLEHHRYGFTQTFLPSSYDKIRKRSAYIKAKARTGGSASSQW